MADDPSTEPCTPPAEKGGPRRRGHTQAPTNFVPGAVPGARARSSPRNHPPWPSSSYERAGASQCPPHSAPRRHCEGQTRPERRPQSSTWATRSLKAGGRGILRVGERFLRWGGAGRCRGSRELRLIRRRFSPGKRGCGHKRGPSTSPLECEFRRRNVGGAPSRAERSSPANRGTHPRVPPQEVAISRDGSKSLAPTVKTLPGPNIWASRSGPCPEGPSRH